MSGFEVTQILLAAGLSSRMGSPKPLLDFGGRPLLERLLEECRRSRVDEIVVVLGHASEQILDEVDLGEARVVINESYRVGQTTSLQCGVRALSPDTKAFLNLPVDYPLMTHREIDALIEAHESGFATDPTAIYVASHEGQWGRPVLFPAAMGARILELGPTDPAWGGLLDEHRDRVLPVPVRNRYILDDMNTQEEYRKMRTIFETPGWRS